MLTQNLNVPITGYYHSKIQVMTVVPIEVVNKACYFNLLKIKLMKEINFDTLVGENALLYYNNSGPNRFQLGSVLFEVIEDPEDGYRSSMSEVKIIDLNTHKGLFLDEVIIESAKDIEGYNITGKDGYIWCKFGTMTMGADDHYPCFIFEWNPKSSNNSDDKEFIKSVKDKLK